jgi:AhpD family alkylhydroperoxidase
MAKRLDYRRASPGAVAAMAGLEQFVRDAGLEKPLLELVKTRVSQINGCAYCLDMHTKDARAAGETEQRLYTLSAWRETSFFTDRERAALAWAESITRIADGPITDALYDTVRQHFSEKELVDLTLAIIAINGWNRFAVPFQAEPGSYQPPKK